MNTTNKLVKNYRSALILSFILFMSIQGVAQPPADWQLEKMPPALETDFALSALPTQLRDGATVYLLDPAKGYYVARKGSNGFICFVARTEWEWGFSRNEAAAISYDAEGARTIFPVYMDVAAMRASGKFTGLQIRDTVIDRIKKGIYKAPARTGISYMLGPVMRAYAGTPADTQVVTMSMPHYMFYAPYLTNTDIGNIPDGQADGPVAINAGDFFLGAGKGPYGYIIVPVGKTEKAKIIAADKDLMDRLIAYKSYFKVGPM
jgi:hypothetical protein